MTAVATLRDSSQIAMGKPGIVPFYSQEDFMEFDENTTIIQVAKNATKTIDGASAYAVIFMALFAGLVVLISNYFGLGLLEKDISDKIFDLTVFSVITTPLMYLGLAYFPVSGRLSEAINSVIIFAANAYMISRIFYS